MGGGSEYLHPAHRGMVEHSENSGLEPDPSDHGSNVGGSVFSDAISSTGATAGSNTPKLSPSASRSSTPTAMEIKADEPNLTPAFSTRSDTPTDQPATTPTRSLPYPSVSSPFAEARGSNVPCYSLNSDGEMEFVGYKADIAGQGHRSNPVGYQLHSDGTMRDVGSTTDTAVQGPRSTPVRYQLHSDGVMRVVDNTTDTAGHTSNTDEVDSMDGRPPPNYESVSTNNQATSYTQSDAGNSTINGGMHFSNAHPEGFTFSTTGPRDTTSCCTTSSTQIYTDETSSSTQLRSGSTYIDCRLNSCSGSNLVIIDCAVNSCSVKSSQITDSRCNSCSLDGCSLIYCRLASCDVEGGSMSGCPQLSSTIH